MDDPQRHGKANVRLREEIDQKYNSLSYLVAQRERQPQLPTKLRGHAVNTQDTRTLLGLTTQLKNCSGVGSGEI